MDTTGQPRLIEAMEEAGLVSEMSSNGSREVLVPKRLVKYILFIWMIIPLTIESSTSEQLNDFFDSDLTFTQTSLNKNKNLIEESEGIFKRLEDNTIVLEISTPFRENYFIDKNKIEIHDLDFDQVRIIKEKISRKIFF